LIGSKLKEKYLLNYFGDSPRIHRFVLFVKNLGNENALVELSDFIRVLGTPPDDKIDQFILNIMLKYGIQKFEIYDPTNQVRTKESPWDTKGRAKKKETWVNEVTGINNQASMERESRERLLFWGLFIIFALLVSVVFQTVKG
jgi:hypothetical protein